MNKEEFEPVGEKITVGKKLKKIGVAIVKVAIPLTVGGLIGYAARKYVDKDVYTDAEVQRKFKERRNNNEIK